MGGFRFIATTDLPRFPELHVIERLTLADREQLGLKFGQPCNPRALAEFYDVNKIVETVEQWAALLGRPITEVEDELKSVSEWSGFTGPLKHWRNVMLINGSHAVTRRNLTVAHEFAHLVRGHRGLDVMAFHMLHTTRYSDKDEFEANLWAGALLIPYAPLVQLLEHGIPHASITKFYGISEDALLMRLKTTGLYDIQMQHNT